MPGEFRGVPRVALPYGAHPPTLPARLPLVPRACPRLLWGGRFSEPANVIVRMAPTLTTSISSYMRTQATQSLCERAPWRRDSLQQQAVLMLWVRAAPSSSLLLSAEAGVCVPLPRRAAGEWARAAFLFTFLCAGARVNVPLRARLKAWL
jgi:hypothetical protein